MLIWNSATDHNAYTFRDILESAGLHHHVNVPIHRNSYTLDLITDEVHEQYREKIGWQKNCSNC